MKTSIDKFATSTANDIADAIYQCISETTVTTMLAQNFHWNVTGMSFGPLHTLFQEIYEDHFIAQDELAERMRAIDVFVEGQLSKMIEKSKVRECDKISTDQEMLVSMLDAQETIASTLAGARDIAASHGDKLTEDLCVQRGRVHEKFVWILKSHIA